MHALTFTLLLAVAMKNTEGNQPTELPQVEAHREQRYHLDVLYQGTEDELRASLDNFTLDHSFKVIGEPRYIYMFRSNDSAALQSLTFPSGSFVTQFPVERAREYFEMLGVDSGRWNFPDSPSSGGVVIFFDWILDMPKNQCPDTFDMEMKAWVELIDPLPGIIKPVFHPVIATYPPRFLTFWELEENATQNIVQVELPYFESYGTSRLELKRVLRI